MVGASITHPDSPATELLKAGVTLDAPMIARLAGLGVQEIWVEDDATADLDAGVSTQLSQAKLEMFTQFKQDLRTISRRTVSTAQIAKYRQSVVSLACLLVGNGKYAGLTDSLFGAGGIVGHATNVAYLSILVGLELEPYIIRERPRLAAGHAKDVGVLGLAGMLHDIGKTRLAKPEASAHHEVHGMGAEPPPEGYDEHTIHGYQLLRESRAPASVTTTVLNHHQRFDGRGWPDLAKVTKGRRHGTQADRQIHIFTRIVSAANVLDNLMRAADGSRLPPVAALHAFASDRFEGWFDPVVRRATLRRVPPFAIGTLVGLSDGRRAVVIRPNLQEPCRPLVRPLESERRANAPPPPPLNLEECRDLTICHYLGVDVQRWNYSLETPAATPEPISEPPPDTPEAREAA